jgi:hypothetical protein
MLKLSGLHHHQLAYVTTDLDEALLRLEKAYGLDRYFFIDTLAEPSYPEQPALKIAMVRMGGTELEIIQAIGPRAELWSDPLPKTGSFALMFHHIAFTVPGTKADYERYRASFDMRKHPVVTEGSVGDKAYWFYTDERATFGHYIEYCWFSQEVSNDMNGAVPRCG